MRRSVHVGMRHSPLKANVQPLNSLRRSGRYAQKNGSHYLHISYRKIYFLFRFRQFICEFYLIFLSNLNFNLHIFSGYDFKII